MLETRGRGKFAVCMREPLIMACAQQLCVHMIDRRDWSSLAVVLCYISIAIAGINCKDVRGNCVYGNRVGAGRTGRRLTGELEYGHTE